MGSGMYDMSRVVFNGFKRILFGQRFAWKVRWVARANCRGWVMRRCGEIQRWRSRVLTVERMKAFRRPRTLVCEYCVQNLIVAKCGKLFEV